MEELVVEVEVPRGVLEMEVVVIVVVVVVVMMRGIRRAAPF